jgi:hypothetical protein
MDEHQKDWEKSGHQEDCNAIEQIDKDVSDSEDTQDSQDWMILLEGLNAWFVLLQVDQNCRCSCQREESNHQTTGTEHTVENNKVQVISHACQSQGHLAKHTQ